jgi:hypothetical protein
VFGIIPLIYISFPFLVKYDQSGQFSCPNVFASGHLIVVLSWRIAVIFCRSGQNIFQNLVVFDDQFELSRNCACQVCCLLLSRDKCSLHVVALYTNCCKSPNNKCCAPLVHSQLRNIGNCNKYTIRVDGIPLSLGLARRRMYGKILSFAIVLYNGYSHKNSHNYYYM